MPEGVAVRVVFPSEPVIRVSPIRKRVQLPLVTGGEPGSIPLTNERIYEILDEEDIASLKGIGDASA